MKSNRFALLLAIVACATLLAHAGPPPPPPPPKADPPAGAASRYGPPPQGNRESPAPVAPKAAPGATAAVPAFGVKVVGKGPPMILIPGLACSGDVWKSTIAHYQSRYQCHVLTVAGFAGQPPIQPPVLTGVRNTLVAYIRARKLDHPVIVGHSLGGFLAFDLAAAEPDLVGPIIAVDGLPFLAGAMNPATTPEAAKAGAETMKQAMTAMKRDAFVAQNKMMLATMITDPTNVTVASKWAAVSDIPSVANAMSEMMSMDLREKVAAIKTPTLLIGAAGFATTPEMRTQAAATYEAQVVKIPNHKVVMAEHSKHFIMFDDPNFMFRTMDDFLKPKGI